MAKRRNQPPNQQQTQSQMPEVGTDRASLYRQKEGFDSKKYKEVNDELKITEELYESIQQKEERLNKLKEKGKENTEAYKKLQEEIDKDLEDWYKRDEKTNQLHEERNTLISEQKKLEEALAKIGERQVSDMTSLMNERAKSTILLENSQQRLTGASAKWAKDQDISLNYLRQQNAEAVGLVQMIQTQGSVSESFMDAYEDHENTAKNMLSIQKDITNSVADASKGEYKRVDTSREQEMIDQRRADLAHKRKLYESGQSDMSKEELESLERRLALDEKSLESLNAQNDALEEASKKAKKVLGTFDKIMELDFKGAIREGFGLDKIQSEVKEKIGATFVNIAAEMKGGNGLVGGLKAAGAGIKGLTSMAGALTKALAFGGLLAIANFVMESFSKVDEEVSKLGKDLGISKHEAIELHHAATDLAGEMGIVGINAEQVAKGVQTASEVMGGLDIASRLAAGDEQAKQLVKDTTILSENFGLAADEIKGIQNYASISGKSMGQLTQEATTLNKGLMTSKESLKLLAKIPPQVAVSFKGGTQELIKAAAKAKLLGTNLEAVQNIGMNMLEIEDSLGKEMEARVLTGKNINLDMARQYALQGDTAKLQDEILNQAGSLKEYQGMNVLAQDAMAKALGKTREEMVTMLTNAENLKNMGIDQAKYTELQEMNAEQLNKELAKGGNEEYKNYVRNLAKEKESEETKKKLADAMTKIQEKLAKLITPLIDMADKFLTVLDNAKALEPVLWGIAAVIGLIATVWVGKKLMDGFSMVKGSIGSLKEGITGFFDMIKGPGADAMSGLTEQASDLTSQVTEAAGGVGEQATEAVSNVGASDLTENVEELASTDAGSSKKGGGISEFFEKMDPKKMLAGAAALLIVAAALWVAAKAMQEFSTGVKWEGVLMGIVTLGALVLAVMALGSIMSSGVGAVAIIAGAAALLILSAALYVMGKAMQEFSKAAVMLIPFFQEMTKLDMDQLARLAINIGLLGGAFALLGTMMIPIMMGAAAFAVLSASLAVFGVAAMIAGKGIKDITTSIAELLSFDASKFDAMANGLETIGSAIMSMGAGSLMAGVGDGISKLFGGESPLDKVANITEKLNPEKLSATAKAIKDLADSFKYFAEETTKLKDFDTDKLDEIIKKMEEVQEAEAAGGMAKAVTGVANAVTGFIGNLFGSPEQQSAQPIAASGGGGVVATQGGGTNMANVEKKLDTLISVISQAANQPTIIKFGDKTVEEIKSQLNFKKAYNVGVDKTYGKTI